MSASDKMHRQGHSRRCCWTTRGEADLRGNRGIISSGPCSPMIRIDAGTFCGARWIPACSSSCPPAGRKIDTDCSKSRNQRHSRLSLEPGDRLGFSLRANPVIRRRRPSDRRSVKHDVVMDALRSLAEGARAAHRLAAVREQGLAWLERQGTKAGFSVRTTDVRVDGYDQHRIFRTGAARWMSYSTLDFDGTPDGWRSCLASAGHRARLRCGQVLRLRSDADPPSVNARALRRETLNGNF